MLAALAAAGCGGESEKERFVEQATTICIDLQDRANEVTAPLASAFGNPQANPAEVRSAYRQLIRALDNSRRRLSRLEPPAEDRAQFDRLLDTLDVLTRRTERSVDDFIELARVQAQVADLQRRVHALGAAGLERLDAQFPGLAAIARELRARGATTIGDLPPARRSRATETLYGALGRAAQPFYDRVEDYGREMERLAARSERLARELDIDQCASDLAA